MKEFYAYHVVTDSPMGVGDVIVFDERHHSGVYKRVMEKRKSADEVYTNPQNYEILEHHTMVALRELALEEVRKNQFSTYPSRIRCLYVSETIEEAKKWCDLFVKLKRPTYSIVKLKIKGNKFIGDSNNCFNATNNKEENLKLAERYWKNLENKNGEEPIKEILVDGYIEVIEIIENVNKNISIDNEIIIDDDISLKSFNTDHVLLAHKNFFSSERSAKYMYWKKSETIEETKNRIEKWKKDYEDELLYFIFERNVKEPIGFLSAVKIDDFTYGDIGLCIGEKFIKKNIGYRVMDWLIKYFENKNTRNVYYTCLKENIASNKLALKCGFKYLKEDIKFNRKLNKDNIEVTYKLAINENKNIWGKKCTCGKQPFAFFDEHYWVEDNIIKKIKCPYCNKIIDVTKDEAIEYYNDLIYKCFEEVRGKVLEIGCGGGLLTSYIANKKEVDQLVAVDNKLSKEEEKYLKELNINKYIKLDLNNFDESVIGVHFDYIVCKDVLMYLDDIDYTFSKLSKISDKIILLNWYNENHKNCINKTKPEDILNVLKKYYDNIEIYYPGFYKYGYLIKTNISNKK